MRKTIKTVIRCPSNMVMAFNGKGEQIPQYQGQYEAVRESIVRDAPQNAVFGYWCGFEPELRKVSREGW